MKLSPMQLSTIEDIKKFHNKLEDCVNFKYNKLALLCALAFCESTLGKFNRPRHEPSYDVGGIYYKRSKVLRAEVNKYGFSAACSWSSFQIMYITAYELGYRGKPEELQNDCTALPYVIKFINTRIIKQKPKSLMCIFDAYNSGNFKDNIIPFIYMDKGKAYYSIFNNMFPEHDKKEEAAQKEQPLKNNIVLNNSCDFSFIADIEKVDPVVYPKNLFYNFLQYWREFFRKQK